MIKTIESPEKPVIDSWKLKRTSSKEKIWTLIWEQADLLKRHRGKKKITILNLSRNGHAFDNLKSI